MSSEAETIRVTHTQEAEDKFKNILDFEWSMLNKILSDVTPLDPPNLRLCMVRDYLLYLLQRQLSFEIAMRGYDTVTEHRDILPSNKVCKLYLKRAKTDTTEVIDENDADDEKTSSADGEIVQLQFGTPKEPKSLDLEPRSKTPPPPSETDASHTNQTDEAPGPGTASRSE